MQSITRLISLHVDRHVVKTKAEHPFNTSNGYVDATDLAAGDLLRTHDGSWATVQAVEVEEQSVHQIFPGVMPYPSSGR